MNYKVKFFNSFGEEIGYREFHDEYYKSINSIRDTIITEINYANINNLVPICGGAIKKSNIDSFVVLEIE